jgi:segregation and condensation protein B
MDNLNKKLGELEALLFIHGEPLSFEKIQSALGLVREETELLISELKKRLGADARGLALVSDRGRVQLVTRPEFAKVLEGFIKEELSEDLTQASLEALAVVVYFGPISRSRIEYLRGVNSSFILRSLLLRGLVERFPDPDRPNSFLYQPTFELLKHLGLTDKKNLPDYEKFQSLLKVFESSSAGGAEETAVAAVSPAEPETKQE